MSGETCSADAAGTQAALPFHRAARQAGDSPDRALARRSDVQVAQTALLAAGRPDLTEGTASPEWAPVTAPARFAWQRAAAAVQAWIAAGELPPGLLPPVTALADELGEGRSAVTHALVDLAARGIIGCTRTRYYARPLSTGVILGMPRRVGMAEVIAAWDGRYLVGESVGAVCPFWARSLDGEARMVMAATAGSLGVRIRADWEQRNSDGRG